MMTKEGSTKIVNFIQVIIVNMYYLLLYHYTHYWSLLCQRIMMLLSDTIVDFHLFYDGAVDIQIWALFTRSQCKISDTQVTVKACRPLVKFVISLCLSTTRLCYRIIPPLQPSLNLLCQVYINVQDACLCRSIVSISLLVWTGIKPLYTQYWITIRGAALSSDVENF